VKAEPKAPPPQVGIHNTASVGIEYQVWLGAVTLQLSLGCNFGITGCWLGILLQRGPAMHLQKHAASMNSFCFFAAGDREAAQAPAQASQQTVRATKASKAQGV
jgi:hypothetical protein